MSYNPYARYTYGGSLYHGRKAIADGGARNGYSNTPGYRPIGKKAISRIVGYDRSGHPIYAYTNAGPTPWSVSQQRRNAQIARGSDTRDAALRNLNQQRTQSDQRVTRKVNERKLAAGAAKREQDLRNSPAKTTKADTKVKNYNNSPLKPINEAKNKAGGWLNTARKNVGNWFDRRGDEARATFRNITNAWDGRAGKGSAKDSYEALNNTAMNYLNRAREMEQRGNTAKAQEYRDKYRQAAAKADKERNAYNNSISGRIDAARRNVGNWFDRRGDEARATINNVRNAVGNAWDGKAGRGTAKDSYEALNNTAMNYLNRAREMEQRGNTAKAQEYRNKYRQAAAKAEKERSNNDAYNNSIRGRLERAGNDVGNWLNTSRRNAGNWFDRRGDEAREFARNTRRRVEEAWDGQAGRGTGADEARRLGREGAGKAANEAQDRFNRSIVGRASTLARNVSNAVSGPARNVRNATRDAGEFVRNTVGNASQKIRSVGEYAKLRANEIRSTISNLPSNVKKQADQIIGDIRSGKTVSEIKAKEIELTNLINNAVGGGFTMPSDSYLNKIDPKKKK